MIEFFNSLLMDAVLPAVGTLATTVIGILVPVYLGKLIRKGKLEITQHEESLISTKVVDAIIAAEKLYVGKGRGDEKKKVALHSALADLGSIGINVGAGVVERKLERAVNTHLHNNGR